MTLQVSWFASLREARGVERESIALPSGDLGALYDDFARRHRFALGRDRIRVALNGEFVPFSRVPRDGDEVVFIPPVSGG